MSVTSTFTVYMKQGFLLSSTAESGIGTKVTSNVPSLALSVSPVATVVTTGLGVNHQRQGRYISLRVTVYFTLAPDIGTWL